MDQKIYRGQLNQRITIKERTRTTDAEGKKTYTDVNFISLWAKVDDLSGKEEEDGKIIALNVRKYIILYFPTLEAKKITDLFITDRNQEYNIHAVEHLGHKKYIQLKCSKRE